jgi:hypothetical protein
MDRAEPDPGELPRRLADLEDMARVLDAVRNLRDSSSSAGARTRPPPHRAPRGPDDTTVEPTPTRSCVSAIDTDFTIHVTPARFMAMHKPCSG